MKYLQVLVEAGCWVWYKFTSVWNKVSSSPWLILVWGNHSVVFRFSTLVANKIMRVHSWGVGSTIHTKTILTVSTLFSSLRICKTKIESQFQLAAERDLALFQFQNGFKVLSYNKREMIQRLMEERSTAVSLLKLQPKNFFGFCCSSARLLPTKT